MARAWPPKFKIQVKNNGQRTLWIALLDLPQNYKVSADLQQSGSVRLEPGQEYSPFGGQEISATIPDGFWKLGVVEYKDILKLIACTDEFDARLLAQPALDLPRTAPPSTRSARGGSLDRLMARVQTRELGPAEGALDDWTTTMVTFTTVRPLDASTIPADPQAALHLARWSQGQGPSRAQGQGPADHRAPGLARPGRFHPAGHPGRESVSDSAVRPGGHAER